jgi:hypothetical protein
MLRTKGSIGWLGWVLGAALLLASASPLTQAQSTPPSQPSAPPSQPSTPPKDENPFPGDAPATPQNPAPQQPAAPPQTATPKPDQTSMPHSDNPFPGEDTNVPIIPAPGAAGSDAGAPRQPYGDGEADSGRPVRRDSDPDGDPVRSPDGLGNYASDSGFSSSRSGLKPMGVEDDSDERPGKSTKNKTREQLIKEDLDVGGFYLEKKDWKGAHGRFQSAFSLDPENPDAIWGLAETERHLQLYKDSADHYKLFLTYDPDSKHGREARKALEEVESAKSTAANRSK